MPYKRYLFACLILLSVLPFAAHAAQSPTITLTVALADTTHGDPARFRSALDAFEAAHPGLKVVVAQTPVRSGKSGDASILKDERAIASTADVIRLYPDQLSEMVTRAGFYLDLKPLIASDRTLNASDYFAPVWDSWAWDGAQWGIPSTFDVSLLLYDRAAFDKAVLAYPTDSWTLDDFSNAVRSLSHNYPVPVMVDDTRALFRSTLGVNLFDANTLPNTPQLDQPAVQSLLEKWSALDRDNLLSTTMNADTPILISELSTAYFTTNHALSAALLPGGRAGLLAQGYAVSSGTQYPQQAYELARFLADRTDASDRSNAIPARRDTGTAAIGKLPTAYQSIFQKALAHTIPRGDLRFTEYLERAVYKLRDDPQHDVQKVLRTAQDDALKGLQLADAMRATALTVATLVPIPTPAKGKVALKFALTNTPQNLPNGDEWDAVMNDFTQHDPEVTQITLDITDQPITNQDDCYYGTQTAFSSADSKFVMPLDSFMDVDPTFNKADFLNGTLSRLQSDNKTWAYPLTIQPAVLRYNVQAFANAGVPAPAKNWTLNEFLDAIKTLHSATGKPAFSPGSQDSSAWLMLIAAYGGLPIDYRTIPATLNFTDPAAIDAIRQALDLAKQGYIHYDSLAYMGPIMLNADNAVPIRSDTLSLITYRNEAADRRNVYHMLLYPSGRKYTGFPYNIGSVSISAQSANAPACYRWIKTLAKHPELFYAMPASRAVLNDPTLVNVQGADAVALYKQIADLLSDPHTIPFPPNDSVPSFPALIIQRWLLQAFDHYVLKDGDLTDALHNAESMAKAFQPCADAVPPYDLTDPQNQYLQGIKACAVKLDPSAGAIFGDLK